MTDPKTFPERLDATKDSAEFASVLNDLFRALEKAIDDEDE